MSEWNFVAAFVAQDSKIPADEAILEGAAVG
jgi:hypothetical protein